MTASRRLDAIVAAADTLDALEVDQSAVIDPFAAIDRLGLALSITKLDNLLGALVPQGTGGVLITSERSPAIQRYTAAHEIGHWILHEANLRMDSETDILGRPSSEMEREAQLFASYFLMPQPLLNQAIDAYDLRSVEIQPEHVYWLSRDLAVSYEAAARRLNAARLISGPALAHILSFGRMAAMQRASAGHRPADGLADVWDASTTDDVVSLVVEERDEVIVGLEEQRLAGWRWMTAGELARRNAGSLRPRRRPVVPSTWSNEPDRYLLDEDLLAAAENQNAPFELRGPSLIELDDAHVRPTGPPAALVEDSFDHGGGPETPAQRRRRRTRARQTADLLEADELAVGGNGRHTFIVRAAEPGEWELQLYYAHAYDPRGEPLLTYELRLTIQPTPTTAFRERRLHSDLGQRLAGDPDDHEEFEVDGA